MRTAAQVLEHGAFGTTERGLAFRLRVDETCRVVVSFPLRTDWPPLRRLEFVLLGCAAAVRMGGHFLVLLQSWRFRRVSLVLFDA